MRDPARTSVCELGRHSQFGHRVRHPESPRHIDAKPGEQGRLRGIGLDDAADLNLTAIDGGKHDVATVDLSQRVEHGARAVTKAGAALSLLARLLERAGEEADKAVRAFTLSSR